MINRVVLVGRITKDPVLRKTQSGTSVVSFVLAVNRNIKKEGQPEADFINCQAWGKTADALEKYTSKGSMIGIDGRIQTRNYDDRDGKRVYVTEVVADSVQLLESKKNAESTPYEATEAPAQNDEYPQEYDSDTLDIASDDLPF